MIYIGFAIWFIAKLAAIIWLIETGHPWWALAVLFLVSVEFKSGKDEQA